MSTSYSNTMGSISLLRNLGLKELTVDNITNNTINTLSIDSNANAITLDRTNSTYNYKNTDPYFTHRLVDSKIGGVNTIVMPDPLVKSGTWVTFINKGTSSFTITRNDCTQIAVSVNAFGQGSSSSCKIITNGSDWYCC